MDANIVTLVLQTELQERQRREEEEKRKRRQQEQEELEWKRRMEEEEKERKRQLEEESKQDAENRRLSGAANREKIRAQEAEASSATEHTYTTFGIETSEAASLQQV